MTDGKSLCIHAGRCGGCLHQHMSYGDQLALKADTLGELFGRFWDERIRITPSPDVFYYRNKIELKFDRLQYEDPPPKEIDRPTVVGFRERGKWYYTMDIEECRIFSPVMRTLLPELRKWYRRHDIRFHEKRTDVGLLKYLVLRESKNEEQRLLILVTAPGELDSVPFVEAVLKGGNFTSIYRGIQRGTGDTAFAEELELLHGEPVIFDTLNVPTEKGTRSLRFEIGPYSFFQVNPPATELLYSAVREKVKQFAPSFVYDFYGGAGGIAFSVNDLCDEVVSVENFEAASVSGRRNAEMNGIENVEFVTLPVEKFLGRAKNDRNFRSDAVAIVDPPRSAMHPRAPYRLNHLGPRAIIYVSCNPKLLARELEILTECYELTDLQAFDLFPHTDHVEVLATLIRRPSEDDE